VCHKMRRRTKDRILFVIRHSSFVKINA
jgi:hypothetical protein